MHSQTPRMSSESLLKTTDPNLPSLALGPQVEADYSKIHDPAVVEAVLLQPAMAALHTQTANHLRHVRFDYRIDPDSPDYTHDYVLTGSYPNRPSRVALEKAAEFFDVLNTSEVKVTPYVERDLTREAELEQQQQAVTRIIINDPLTVYTDFHDRLAKQGAEASFPEFESTIELLKLRMLSSSEVQGVCAGDPKMEKFRTLTLARLDKVLEDYEHPFPYTTSILTIERAVEFFDIVERARMGEGAPELYHSGRYEYYSSYLLAQEDHVMFPTTASLGATDLIKVRGVPIGFVGVNTDTERVDGFQQTPYEFFHHDVNHSRRMFQFFRETADSQGLAIMEFAQKSSDFVKNSLLPLILPRKGESTEDKNHRIATRMLMFEMLHEDALAASPETLETAIMRPAMQRTPFERIDNDKTVTYVMEPGATTLSYVFRKLAHTFYDSPDQRYEALGGDGARSRLEIVKASVDLYRTVSDDPIDDSALLKRLEQLVVTDEGFPEAFMAEVLDDMKIRGEQRHDATFVVSRPTSAEAALARIRSLGKNVHSIFGFSNLGYKNSDQVMATIEKDLTQLDPSATAVAIGATQEGIGAAYAVAKRLGFLTLGIVSSKSLVYDGEYSPAVDELIIVHDTEWGGYDETGDMTPTTQVFVKASSSIAAYGGGVITGVSITEASKRGARVTYTPAEMNSAHPATRDTRDPIQLQGAAYYAWQMLIARQSDAIEGVDFEAK